MEKCNHIKWTAHSKYVDITTGEQITKHNATHNYVHIKTTKYVYINKKRGTGIAEYIHEYEPSRQQSLF